MKTLTDSTKLNETCDLISQYGYDISSEGKFQAGLEELFISKGISYEREKKLDEQSRIDFFLPDGNIGIELKINGSEQNILRQMSRYAGSPEIDFLIIFTRRLYSFPETINGTPLKSITLWNKLL